MAGNHQIRQAQPGDANAIAAIHAAAWQATYRGMMPDAYLDTLTAESRRPMWDRVLNAQSSPARVWAMEWEGEVAGFAWTGPPLGDDPPADTGELYAIYLRPGLERRGLGRHLLAQAERGLAAQGCTQAVLRVHRNNLAGQRFYKAAGWHTDGEVRRDEVLGTLVVELVYRRTLPKSGEPSPPGDASGENAG